jgi:hypothetical protein
MSASASVTTAGRFQRDEEQAPEAISHGPAGSRVRLITAPHVHVIQTRSASTPLSSSPQYSCS